MKKFKVHMMYDTKTGKAYKANTMADHNRMDKLGYTHTKPKLNKIDIFHEKRAEGVTQYSFFKLFKLWFQMISCIKLNLLNSIIFFFPKVIAYLFLSYLKVFSKHKDQYLIEKKINI